MNDPKYDFRNGKLRHIEGNYEVDKDEPIMVLRGKDVGALVAITAYVNMLEKERPNKVINSHLDSSLERLEAFVKYQIDNPNLQSIGCSIAHHTGSVLYITEATNKLEEWT